MCDNENPFTLNTATPVGGNYLVNGINSNTFTPSSQNIGTNTITYNYTDLFGCSNSSTQSIIVNPSPSATAITTNVTCNGFSDGSANLIISSGTSPFLEDWGVYNPLALSAGNYSYTVTDLNGCVYTDSITIYEPYIYY